ncbi:C4b-binding protein alpha chain [Ctenodactylus gundi]
MLEKQQVMPPTRAARGTLSGKKGLTSWPLSRLWRVSNPALFRITLAVSLLATALGGCGPPPPLNYASPVSDTNQTDFKVGTILKYTCRPGYSRSSSSLSVICDLKGEWKTNIVCVKKRCRNPGDLPNGLVKVKTDFSFGSQIEFSCSEGYILIGSTTSVCEIQEKTVEWSDPFPVCEIATCEPPPVIVNGRHSGTDEDHYTYGASVTYSCDRSYSLLGSDSISCTVENETMGVWRPSPPTCETLCPKPEIDNGKLSVDKAQYVESENVTIHCDSGFGIVGSQSITCLENRTWFPEMPKCKWETREGCEPVELGKKLMQCLPDPADVKMALEVYKLSLEIELLKLQTDKLRQSTLDFNYCANGVTGAQHKVAVEEGSACKYCSQCFRKCIVPPISVFISRSKESCTIRPYVGAPVASTALSSLLGPRVTDHQEAADPLSFLSKVFHSIAHGHYKRVNSYNIFKYEVLYECEEGYRLIGKAKLSCISSHWSSEAPQCKALCLKPKVENGKLSVNKALYVESENVTILCGSGFGVVGPPSITCLKNGTWYPEVPKCEWEVPRGCEQVVAGRKLMQCLPSLEEVKMALEVYKMSLENELLELQKDKAKQSTL